MEEQPGGPRLDLHGLQERIKPTEPNESGPRAVRAVLMRSLGRLAAAAGRPPPELLVAGLCDPEVVVQLGALEGVTFLGDQAPVSVIGPLAGAADPRVRVRAWVALFAAGEVDQGERFLSLLGSDSEREVLPALNALLELGLLAAVACPLQPAA